MSNALRFYIDGAWVNPVEGRRHAVINPATEMPCGEISLGSAADVDRAVAAARKAFPAFAATSRVDRLTLLGRIVAAYEKRQEEMAQTISREMGAPIALCRQLQAPIGLWHFTTAIDVLKSYAFEEAVGQALVVREPIGVCGLITPWNWPMNQVVAKVAPAIATGCTVVLKPSEVSPLSAMLFAEILHDAGVPPGVFNLVNGDGPTVGAAIAGHPDIDMVSFTGSTRAGIQVAKAAADTVKRVALELGGKSPNILLDDATFAEAVEKGVNSCFANSGQSCNAPTRMLVPAARAEEAIGIARAAAEAVVVGDPSDEGTGLGPVANALQFGKIQKLIEQGVSEGARLVVGGAGRPAHFNKGFYVRPTVFADVTNDMTIAREEIFGPVLSILSYRDIDDAIRIANDTVYGLSSYVTAADPATAVSIGRRIRAGMVHINGAFVDVAAPFGGYKQSGNGREWGKFGLEDFLEVKTMFGYAPVA
jgi:aldehyde dehydrogenase (NAD+)